MSKIVTLTTLAALTLSAVAMQTSFASAGPYKTISGGYMDSGSGGGGHNHHPYFNISFDSVRNIDPAYFCRWVTFKHKLIRVCDITPAG